MVMGRMVEEGDQECVALDEGGVEAVDKFPYLGSLRGLRKDGCRCEQKSCPGTRAFGALRKSVFFDKNLSLTTKWKIYSACVLPVLLYGAEYWIPLRKHEKLNTFHHRCIRIILGISNQRQWSERITMGG